MKLFYKICILFLSDCKSRSASYAMMFLALAITITTVGCNSYDKDMLWIDSLYASKAPRNYNPRFIFETPDKNKHRDHITAEQFGRAPWPVSPEANYYVTDAETTSYREYMYSDQYIGFDNKPRNRFHLRSYSRRIGGHTR